MNIVAIRATRKNRQADALIVDRINICPTRQNKTEESNNKSEHSGMNSVYTEL